MQRPGTYLRLRRTGRFQSWKLVFVKEIWREWKSFFDETTLFFWVLRRSQLVLQLGSELLKSHRGEAADSGSMEGALNGHDSVSCVIVLAECEQFFAHTYLFLPCVEDDEKCSCVPGA